MVGAVVALDADGKWCIPFPRWLDTVDVEDELVAVAITTAGDVPPAYTTQSIPPPLPPQLLPLMTRWSEEMRAEAGWADSMETVPAIAIAAKVAAAFFLKDMFVTSFSIPYELNYCSTTHVMPKAKTYSTIAPYKQGLFCRYYTLCTIFSYTHIPHILRDPPLTPLLS